MKQTSGSWAWVPWIFLICPLLSGCFPLLYAYPSISFVPSIDPGPVPDKVYAFRVDVTDERNGNLAENDRYVLRELALGSSNRVPMQAKIDVDRGWFLVSDRSQHAHTRHAVMVRLYRPGWDTIEIHAPDDAHHVRWFEAGNPGRREEAVDALLSTWETDVEKMRELSSASVLQQQALPTPIDVLHFRNLAPGSASGEHCRALLFAAGEYERIAAGLGQDEPGRDVRRESLLVKAHWLRKRASE
jgi:hypothetical protein